MTSIKEQETKNRAIIIAEEIDLRVLTALERARTISEDIVVFATFSKPEDEETIWLLWRELKLDINLVLRYSRDGEIVMPLLDYMRSPEFALKADEIVTVILPRIAARGLWQRLLDTQVSRYIERGLSGYQEIKVEVVPVQLQRDNLALGSAIFF